MYTKISFLVSRIELEPERASIKPRLRDSEIERFVQRSFGYLRQRLVSHERTEARLALICSTVWSLLVTLVLHEKPRYVFFTSFNRSRIEAYNILFVLYLLDYFLFPLSQCPPFARRVSESSRERVGKKKCHLPRDKTHAREQIRNYTEIIAHD